MQIGVDNIVCPHYSMLLVQGNSQSKVKTEIENKIKGKTVCKSKFPRDVFDDVMLRISIDPANIVEEDSRLTQHKK